MSYNSAQHRSRSNPPPTHRSQLPTLHHLARPDAYRKDTAPSPTTPTQQYQQFGEPIRQSTHISYPTRLISDSGSSDSERALLEQPQTHSTLRRRPTGKRKTSVTSAVASDALLGSRHRRRGSGPEDLALLETHILPSLSKTIDRMTNVKAQVPSLQTPDLNDNSVLPLPKSSRMQSKLPTVKPSSQPSTPRPILKSSMRSPITPTISSFTPANSSLRSVKGFSPSPRLQGYFDDLTPTFSPTSLLSERPPTYLSPQGQVPDTSALYNSTPKTPSRKQTISQQPSSRPSHATTNYIPHRPKSPDHTLDHTAEQASLPLPLLSPIIAERPPWDEVLSEAWHLGSRLSHNSTNMRPQKSAVSPQKEEFHPSERTHEVHHGSHNNPSDYPPYGDNAALQRKRRETLLAIVEGVNAQFDTGAPTRESSEYSGHVGLAIGSRESTFGEGMASLHRPPSADQHSQGSGKGWRRSSASSASREGNTGEERPSRYERTPSSNSPRIGHDTDHAYQERKGCSPNRDPVTPPPEPNPDARISRRSPVRNSSEPTRPVRAPTPPDYLYQSHREQKRRSVSTPPVVRRSKIDLVQNGKKREAGSLLPRTRSSLFLPTDAKVSRPTSGDGLDAFGLPPSLSYVFKDASGHAGITPAESGKSLEDRTECWKKDLDVRKVPEDFLSNGAEKLFQSLVDEDTSRGSNGSSRSPRHFSQASPTPARRTSMPTARSDFSIASMSSAPSVYDDLAEEYEGDNERRFLAPPNPQPSASHVPPSWRSSISPSVYNSFVRLYGEIEMQRQEVIFDICRTEALFVQRLRTALRLFIRPLRAQDTSTWISGVPWSVARLFDWFEDILNLHVEINVELRQARSDPQAVVERFAGMLRKFVPRFEVYQPYIMRLEGVLGQLKGEGDNDTDGNWANFREFVSIQELEEGCEGWSLQSLLLEPIHRSSECVEMLQLLLERTSKQHVDHLSTVSLVFSMKMMFRVIQEVKAREKEHDLIKVLVSNIEGLPPSSLARRERRLLIRGSCRLLVSRSQTRSQRNSHGNPQSLVLLDAIDNWESTKRSGKRRSLVPVSSPDVHPSNFAGSPSKTTSGGSASCYDLDFSPVEVLVFSDVIVVTTPTGKNRCKLAEKFGIARVLSVTENIVVIQGHEEHVIELDLIPVSDLQLGQTQMEEDDLMSKLVLGVRVFVDAEHESHVDPQDTRKRWLASFEKCRRAATLSFEFPLRFDLHQGLAAFGGIENFNVDRYQKEIGGGLPFPKSPSMRVQTHNRRQRRRSDFAQTEREERDWWSFRFKEVYLEMQRDER